MLNKTFSVIFKHREYSETGITVLKTNQEREEGNLFSFFAKAKTKDHLPSGKAIIVLWW